MSAVPLVRPMLAASIRTGFVPNSFDNRILTLLPPMLTRTIWRTVWFEKLVGMTPRGSCGLAVQVLIQDCAIAGMVAWTPKAAVTIARKTARLENIFASTHFNCG